jgi:hypothetical protein
VSKWRHIAALLLVTALAAGCSATRSGEPAGSGEQGRPVLTPAAAKAIVGPTMSRNNRANASLDTSLLASYEAGSAFRLDSATYRAVRRAERATGSKAWARSIGGPFSVSLRTVAIERTGAYPARFLAIGDVKPLSPSSPSGPRCATILEFERRSARASWRIVLEPTVDASLSSSRLPSGYERRPSKRLARQASRLPGAVVKALLAEETSGKLGPFKRSDFAGGCWQLPNPRADVLGANASGFDQRDLFSVLKPSDTSVFPISAKSALAVFTLDYDDQLIAGSTSRPLPWTHPSIGKDPSAAWTYLLPKGYYSEVSEKGELEVAAEVSASGSYVVVGSYEGVTSLTGRRARRGGSPSPGGTLTSFGSGASSSRWLP